MKVLVADEDSGSIKGTLTIQNYCPFFSSSSKRKVIDVGLGTNWQLIEIVFEKGTDTSQKTAKQPISTTTFGQLGRARYTQKLALINGGKHVSYNSKGSLADCFFVFFSSPRRLLLTSAAFSFKYRL